MVRNRIKFKSLILGKKEKEKKIILTEDDFNHNYFMNREIRRVR